ncbi:hypothetical protein [Amphritea sp.]|uniref:hypothetical protein n=1 Tax=Amphritea sp. TaxID=1872502 RepID=UPI0025C4AD61|nr:hypothetical protein [Amphritea sp.]
MKLELLAHLQVDHLVYLGAGDLNEETVRFLETIPKVTLVEAQSSLCESLQERFQDMEHITVINEVIAGNEADTEFYIYNLIELSGLVTVENLKTFYPGLRVLENTSVKTIGVVPLLEQIGLDAEKNIVLVVDIPFQVESLLDEVIKAEVLNGFSLILCSTPTINHEVKAANSSLTHKLQQARFDYDLVSLLSERNGLDYQTSVYRQSSLLQEHKQVTEDLIAYEKRNIQQSKEIKALQTQVSKVQEEAKTTQSEQKLLKAENSTLQGQYKSKQRELDRALKEHAGQQETQQSLFNQLQCQNKKVQIDLHNERELTDSTQAHNETLKAELKTLQQERDNASKERESVGSERDEIKSQLEKTLRLLQAKNNLLNEKFEQISRVQNNNSKLNMENEQLKKENTIHKGQLTKAEYQIELIKELLVP